MKKAEINGIEITIQERSDWKTSIDEDFKPGDYFDGKGIKRLLNKGANTWN